MFVQILYYTVVITGALTLATLVVRLIDRIDHPTRRKESPSRHTRPAAAGRAHEKVSGSAKRAA